MTAVGCLLIFFSSIGGHWLVLQSFAWGKMLYDYSRQAPIAEAVVKTFGGKNPCNLCHQIREGQGQEEKAKKDPKTLQERKLERFCLTNLPGIPVLDSNPAREPFTKLPSWSDWDSEPPTRPPSA